MKMDFIRRTWAEIDLDALDYNIKSIKAKMKDGQKVMGIVKADCYGHGDGFIARKLDAAGFDWFGVSNIEEGMSLRTEGITKPILILGYTPVDCANILAEQKITQALIGMEYCKALQTAAEKAGVVVDGHIKLDTGMTRVGFQTDDENFEESLKEINAEGAAFAKYDRHCLGLSKEEVQAKLDAGVPFVIRQKMPDSGTTTFSDVVYGDITVENTELDDQILMKADGFPTYNFANVVDDHLMHITHVVRGSEYLSSTPKYNLLYKAFGWEPPVYVHLPAVMRDAHHKLSKRHGDKSFEDLVREGYVVEAIVNYIALLGWSPSGTQEIFSLKELEENFDMAGLSKSPAIFDIKKLTWMNSEYLKAMDFEKYYALAEPKLKEALGDTDLDLKKIAALLQKRLETLNDIPGLVEFFKTLPEYGTELYTHKKMKTNDEIALSSLEAALPVLENLADWNTTSIHDALMALVGELGIKNGQLLWPVRTALSGEPTSPGGAMELADILGKEESLRRIRKGIELLKG